LSTIIDLGANFRPGQINASGQVVGTGSSPADAFLYSDGTLTDLGTVPGYVFSNGDALNDYGTVVGSLTANNGNSLTTHAMAYYHGTMTDRGTAPGFTDGYALGINDSNQAIGNAYNGDSGQPDHAFLYSAGTLTDLGSLSPRVSTDAHGINASAEVVGQSGYAFLWKDGVMTNIDNRGVFSSTAVAINDSGQVACTYLLDNHNTNEPFLWTPDEPNGTTGTAVGLGFLPGDSVAIASAINSAGEVVGQSGFTNTRAFLYRDGTMMDLNTLLPPNSGWQLQKAIGINDSEQIVGIGMFQGEGGHAFLLNLNDAPATRGAPLGAATSPALAQVAATTPEAGRGLPASLAPVSTAVAGQPANDATAAAPVVSGVPPAASSVGLPASPGRTATLPDLVSAADLDLFTANPLGES
jgi:probable HAF family extracellular repeat protein